MARLQEQGVSAVFHYVPLHSSPAGIRYGRISGSLAITDDVSGRLLRLPLWMGIDDDTVERVSSAVLAALPEVLKPTPRLLR
jgi:dTDP-4-amino-4,6-dideoxygalactose transaminase